MTNFQTERRAENVLTEGKIVDLLTQASLKMGAVELAEMLERLTGGGLTQGSMITYFKRAVPEIPLKALLDAGARSRLTAGSMSDKEFDQALAAWLPHLR